jgi:oxygen-independent coproporphyrinogen-3 oxidase
LSGIYIHIPFCKQACHYCNFHFSTSLKQKDDLIASIVKEIELTTTFTTKKEVINTLYFGGGTPSILTIEDLSLLLDSLKNKFVFSDTIEITLEANPDDISNDRLQKWKSIGINRFSVGIQTLVEQELRWMNRAHTAKEATECIDKIKQAGFNNFSIDLIYGSPLLSNEDWMKNVHFFINKKVPHISCYALTVEPKTALDKMIVQKKKEAVSTDKQAEQFDLLVRWMKAAGYEQYEISNFAIPGFRSNHNSSYWQGKPYYGFGPSAHSYDGIKRRWNIANNALYIQALQNNQIPFEEEILTTTQQLNEYIMTSLRTIEGLDLAHVSTIFGEKLATEIRIKSTKWGDKIIITNSIIALTDTGKFFADGIAADLFF